MIWNKAGEVSMKLSKVKTGLMAVIVGIFSIAMLLVAFLFNSNKPVNAFNSSSSINSNAVIVPQLWDETTQFFNMSNFLTLLSYISSDGTVSGVNTTRQTATDIRGYTYGGKSNGQAVVVELGSYQWQVVYLTRTGDTTGDRIATLLMVNNDSTTHYGSSDTTANYGSSSFTSGYPTSMYGTSYIRAVTLNNGGKYVNIVGTSNPTTTTTASKSSSHKYALYTVESLGLTDYLVQPQNIWYQTQAQLLGSSNPSGYTLNNESLSTSISTGWYEDNSDSYSCQTKQYYTEWGDDYLWLPSLSEVGANDTDSGIWELSVTERASSSYSWTRSSNSSSAFRICMTSSSGSGWMSGNNYQNYGLRPALHLNLDNFYSITTDVDENIIATPSSTVYPLGSTEEATLVFSPQNLSVARINLSINGNPLIINANEESSRAFINYNNEYQYKCYRDGGDNVTLILKALTGDLNITATSTGVTASYTGGSGTIEMYETDSGTQMVLMRPVAGQYVNTLTIDGATITPTYYYADIIGAGNALKIRYTAKDTSNLFVLELEEVYDNINIVFNLATTRPTYEMPPNISGGVGIVGTVATATSGGEVRMVGNDIANGEDTDTVTFIALAYSGYRFVGWVNANNEDETFGTSTNISLTKEQVNGKVIKAVFEPVDTDSSTNDQTNNYDDFA